MTQNQQTRLPDWAIEWPIPRWLKERRETAVLRNAIKAGGMDISPCRVCGTPVVCVPDGLVMCVDCVEKQQ